MSSAKPLFEALPESPHVTATAESTRSVFARTGILPCQAVRAMISGGEIMGAPEIEANQIQPASLDLQARQGRLPHPRELPAGAERQRCATSSMPSSSMRST